MEEMTIFELQDKMESGEYSARMIAEMYLERIEAIDKQGPRINAIIELNPDVLAIADALDAEREAKGPRGLLHGIPVLLKDNIDTADRMMTTAGSLALAGSTPPQDAYVAHRLRQAGAVILGKTNLSEWANFRSTHSTSGWSSRGGPNPEPLRPGSKPVWFQLRLGGCGCGKSVCSRDWHRNGRIDHLSFLGELHRRD